MKRLSSNAKGFTLLELLVAITLLAIGLMATVSMQQVAIRSNAISNTLSTGSGIAQRVAEEVLSLDMLDPIFSSAGAANYYTFDTGGGNARIPTLTIAGVGAFNASYAVSPNDPIRGATNVVVTVNYVSNSLWDPGAAVNRTVARITAYKRTPS